MRNKANILVEHNDHVYTKQIIGLKELWAIFYDDTLITEKIINTFTNNVRYHTNVFQSQATAVNYVNKLNKKFKTTKFNTRELINSSV